MDGQHVKVYCSFEGNFAWTVFQRMLSGSEDFSRPWGDYVKGFGDLSQEFWLGSEILHLLTTSGNSVLRVDMVDHYGRTTYAEYSTFLIANASNNYTITALGYSGNAGDGEGASWDTWTQITKYLRRSEMKVRRNNS
ncbi:ficolin-1-A-like [Saccostrea echinata]|uniref:ficolin-1-A-like n=1 Tax=Saccostrea echinata TaxID=191078 RepID=UPI002A828E37|nr:ficolin-1-A-like [Saccostrea echinata]